MFCTSPHFAFNIGNAQKLVCVGGCITFVACPLCKRSNSLVIKGNDRPC